MARTPKGDSGSTRVGASSKRRAPSLLSRSRSENRKLREKLKAFEFAGAAGIAITVSLDKCLEDVHGILRPALVPVAKRYVEIATSGESEDDQAMKAGAWIFDREAGKVPDKVNLDAKINGPMYFVPGLPAPTAKPAPEGDGA